jgi:hypothetical protein
MYSMNIQVFSGHEILVKNKTWVYNKSTKLQFINNNYKNIWQK